MSATEFTLRRLTTLDRGALTPLLIESRATGHHHIGRLIDDYESGANRFEQPGEALLAIFHADQLIAIGGLNRSPFSADATSARIRRVYVLVAYRRRGVGRMLMAAILAEAEANFSHAAPRTSSAEAAAFYESLGWRKTDAEGFETTHVLDLRA